MQGIERVRIAAVDPGRRLDAQRGPASRVVVGMTSDESRKRPRCCCSLPIVLICYFCWSGQTPAFASCWSRRHVERAFWTIHWIPIGLPLFITPPPSGTRIVSPASHMATGMEERCPACPLIGRAFPPRTPREDPEGTPRATCSTRAFSQGGCLPTPAQSLAVRVQLLSLHCNNIRREAEHGSRP